MPSASSRAPALSHSERPAIAKIAVLGNPNAGKSTLFNALTGLNQKVANYPGVTVEKKTGSFTVESGRILLMDLPGTYSLAAHSPDEMVAVDVLAGRIDPEDKPDAVLCIVDASNIERNLYLVSQVLEMGLPVVVALNMMDVAAHKGIEVDAQKLSQRLGVSVVATEAHRSVGVAELKAALARTIRERELPHPIERYEPPAELAGLLETTQARLSQNVNSHAYAPRQPFEWLRVLVDEGGYAEERLRQLAGEPALEALKRIRAERHGVPTTQGSSPPLSALEAQSRYRWIRKITEGCITRRARTESTWTDRVDRILTHRVSGTIVLALSLLLLFQSIFTWATPAMDLLENIVGSAGSAVARVIPGNGALESLLVDGVFGGVGSIVVFLPQILLLFFFLGFLEDCGYMARAAFLMDRFMASCGLSGKAFIPMLSGFACAVPAVMGTRVIEDRKDRLTTILVTPLTTCSARLPVYTLLIAAFIPAHTLLGGWISLPALVMFLLYLLGILSAIAMAWLFKRTILKGPAPPFVLELPSYKWPSWKTMARRLIERARLFLTRAGTVILAMSILIWALAYFPRSPSIQSEYETLRQSAASQWNGDALEQKLQALSAEQNARELENSFLGRIGQESEPLFRPLGWDWRITVATLASFPAREVVIAVLGTLYSLGDEAENDRQALMSALQASTWPDGTPVFNIPVALSLMVFFALCCQCGATIATIRRETNSWGLAAFTFGYMTALAYLASLCTYQIGILFL